MASSQYDRSMMLLVHYAAPGLVVDDYRWRKVAESLNDFKAERRWQPSFDSNLLPSASTLEEDGAAGISADVDNARVNNYTVVRTPLLSEYISLPKVSLDNADETITHLSPSQPSHVDYVTTSAITNRSAFGNSSIAVHSEQLSKANLGPQAIRQGQISGKTLSENKRKILVPRSTPHKRKRTRHSALQSSNPRCVDTTRNKDHTRITDSFIGLLSSFDSREFSLKTQQEISTRPTRASDIVTFEGFQDLDTSSGSGYDVQMISRPQTIDQDNEKTLSPFVVTDIDQYDQAEPSMEPSTLTRLLRSTVDPNTDVFSGQTSRLTDPLRCSGDEFRSGDVESDSGIVEHQQRDLAGQRIEQIELLLHRIQTLPNRVAAPMRSHTGKASLKIVREHLFLTSNLARLAREKRLSTAFKPASVVRDVKNIERGYWSLRVLVKPTDDVADEQQDLTSSQHSDIQYLLEDDDIGRDQNVIDIRRVLYPDIDPEVYSPWTSEGFFWFFERLQTFVSKGMGGVGVRLTIEKTEQTDYGVQTCLRLWSFGEVLSHLWLVLRSLSSGHINSMPLEWIGSQGKAVLRMTGRKQRGGDFGLWICKGRGEKGCWGVA